MHTFASGHCGDRHPVRPWGLAFLLGLVLIGTGCGDSSFLARTYTDFTAYYNTFYNANKAFEKGMESLMSREERVNREQYLSVFQQPGSEGDENFKKAISKSASLLRKHPDSKWVDDALVLIGKAYYFQQNFVGAEQKFREVIDLGTDLEGKARFWLARTLVTADRYEEAVQALTAGLGEQEDYGTWTDQLYLVRGQLAVRQGRWEEAEAALSRGLEGDLPDDVGARGAFLLGQVHETLEQYEAAAEAYDRVLEHGPRYELSYAAKYSAIRMLGRSGDTEVALDRLGDMEGDDKNYDRRKELTLLRGQLYRMQGDRYRARETLQELLYGGDDRQDRPSGTVKGRVHYALGILHRDAFSEFEKAAAHFDTAATSLTQPSGAQGEQNEDQKKTPFAITDSRNLADQYGAVADRAQSVARMDSLLRLGRMSASEFEAFVAELKAERAAERRAQQRARERRASAQRFASRGPTGGRGQRGTRTTTVSSSSESSFLYHEDPVRVQEGKRSFQRTWGDRPRVPNWRRREAISGGGGAQDSAQTASARAGNEPRDGGSSESGTEPVQVDVSAVPRDSSAQVEMEKERAVARYELGSALFLSANRPDSAAVWFQRVIDEHGDHPVARRALYALAEVRMAQGQTEKGRELYRRLLEQYPDSEFADRALRQLDQSSEARVKRPDARADSAYASAYERWQVGDLGPAFRSMSRIVSRYPDTPTAPRAALATGVLYHHLAPGDTSGVFRAQLASVTRALSPQDSATVDSAGRPPGPVQADSLHRDAAPADSTVADTVQTDTLRADGASRPPEPGSGLTAGARGAPSRGVEGDSAQARTPAADSGRTAPRTEPPQRNPTQTVEPPVRVAADSARSAEPDSTLGATADTTRSPADSVSAVADTTRRPGPRALLDSAGTDTTQRPVADTTRAQPADTSSRTSAVRAGGSSSGRGPLVAFLRRLTERYPDTPQARRAEQMIDALTETPETPSRTPADSATVVADTTRIADRRIPSDSMATDTSAVSPVSHDTTSTSSARADSTTMGGQIPGPPSARDRPRTGPDTTRADSSQVDSTREAIPPPPGRGTVAPDSQASSPSTIPSPAVPDTSSGEQNGSRQ